MSNPYEKQFELILNEHAIVMTLMDYIENMREETTDMDEVVRGFVLNVDPLIEHNLSLRVKGAG